MNNSVKDNELSCSNKCLGCISESKLQGIGSILQGIGLIIAALAAIWVACNSKDIYYKLLEIQQQAKAIQEGVDILKDMRKREDVRMLVQATPLSQPSPTRQQIETVVNAIPESSDCHPGVYLPPSYKAETIENLQKTSTVQEREIILQNSLRYNVPSNSSKCFSKGN